jgi:hypothetical protein
MLCRGILKEIPNTKIIPCKKDFFYFDGSKNRTVGIVELDLEYEGKKTRESFNIVNEKNAGSILLCNSVVKRLTTETCKIPVECSINTGDSDPVSWNRPIRSWKDKKDFESLIKDLEERKIIESSKSNWLNPVVLTRKKNGELRFCVDFRRLNKLVKLDEFQIPKIDELIATLRGKSYFTTIDLKDGFFQVPIKEADKIKTAFYTGSRLMQFTRMPQGFKNSPAIFQRMMSQIFSDLIGKKCLVYIDDILVFGENIIEHDKNLEDVLEILKKYGLEENLIKRNERKTRIQFLGYDIEKNKIKPTLVRAQGIADFPIPKNKKQVQKFLGMINYDRLFVKNITETLKPLYNLLNKDKKFEWGEAENESFIRIKNKLGENLELFLPDFNKTFYLERDASEIGIGARH